MIFDFQSDTFKNDTMLKPRRRPSNEPKKGFHLENQRPRRKHPKKHHQGGSRHPKTSSLLTLTL
jgi:hypothetical protein